VALIPYLLVVISAMTHATWNLLAKRAGGSQVFLGLSKLSEGILLAPIVAIWLVIRPAPVGRYWYLFVIGALFTTLNYIFLGEGYKRGNLSTVYPVARSSALVFVPFMALSFFGERIDWLGGVSIALILLGLFSMQLDSYRREDVRGLLNGFRHPSMLFALAAGLMVACYSLWDKNSLTYLDAFPYYYGYTLISGIAYLVMLRSRQSWQAIREEFRASRWRIPAVGMLNTFTYMLVLTALAVSKASYVVALRQLSIGLGAVMGWTILHEPSPLPKRIGLALLLAGCLLVSFAR
jgi:uncharacterized membrane protein